MLIGVEYNKMYRSVVASYYDVDGKISFRMQRLVDDDLFVWRTSGKETKHVGWDGKTYLKKESTDRINRYRLEELMHEKFTDEDWKEINADNRPKPFYLDIEVEANDDNEFPEAVDAKYAVNLITLVFDNTVCVLSTMSDLDSDMKSETIAFVNNYFKDFKKTYTLNYFYFETEKQLLEKFFHVLLPKIPMITGWNVIEYDWLTLVNRAKRNGIDITLNLPSTMLLGKMSIPVHLGLIDYIEAFMAFKPMKTVENFQLKYIANRSLGVTKLEHRYKSFMEFQKHTDVFIKYNIIDAVLVQLIDEKHQLLEASYAIASIAGIELNRIFSPVFMTEMLMCKEFILDNKIVWAIDYRKHDDEDDKKKYKGAFVKEPVPGFYKYATCFDFSSMYPNIQMQFNVSPDTYLGRTDEIDVKKLVPGTYTVTKNNTVFALDRDSAARKILSHLYGERDAMQQRITELELSK